MAKQHKSKTSHAILDPVSRKRKADKIAQALKQHIPLKQSAILDIGTGAGYIAHHLSKHAKAVSSIDLVDERHVTDGYRYVKVSDEQIPFPDNTFDAVISNHVVEHVRDQRKHLREVMRVLKPNGVAYVATPNKYWLVDPHYKVAFINWMPRPIAARYLRLRKGSTWDITPASLRTLRKLAGRQHGYSSIVADVLKSPERYNLDTMKPLHPITRRTPRQLLNVASHIAPTILVIIKKQ